MTLISKPTRRVSLTTREEDFIAEDFANEKWSLFKIVNFAILFTIVPGRPRPWFAQFEMKVLVSSSGLRTIVH